MVDSNYPKNSDTNRRLRQNTLNVLVNQLDRTRSLLLDHIEKLEQKFRERLEAWELRENEYLEQIGKLEYHIRNAGHSSTGGGGGGGDMGVIDFSAERENFLADLEHDRSLLRARQQLLEDELKNLTDRPRQGAAGNALPGSNKMESGGGMNPNFMPNANANTNANVNTNVNTNANPYPYSDTGGLTAPGAGAPGQPYSSGPSNSAGNSPNPAAPFDANADSVKNTVLRQFRQMQKDVKKQHS